MSESAYRQPFCNSDRFSCVASWQHWRRGPCLKITTTGSERWRVWDCSGLPNRAAAVSVCTRGSDEPIIVLSCDDCYIVQFLTAGSKGLFGRFGRNVLPPSVGFCSCDWSKFPSSLPDNSHWLQQPPELLSRLGDRNRRSAETSEYSSAAQRCEHHKILHSCYRASW